jgi:hypothetical protein
VSLTEPTFPCAVQLNGGTINNVANTTPLHSNALVSGTLNVTPLTDLIVAFNQFEFGELDSNGCCENNLRGKNQRDWWVYRVHLHQLIS